MTPTLDCTTLLLLLLISAVHAQPGTMCSVDVQSLRTSPPRQQLLLVPGGSKDVLGFKNPDSTGIIRIMQSDKMLIACPGSQIKATRHVMDTASCLSGINFIINNAAREFTDLFCTSRVKRESKTTGLCGSRNQYHMVQIGFQVGYDFYKLIEVCFDGTSYTTVYATSTIVPEIAGHQKNYSIATWSKDFFGNIKVENQYRIKTEIDTFTKLLGSEKQATKFISQKDCSYLVKGHLVARCDFMFGSQQDATFMYVNAVPQWQRINSGNWKTLENSIRKLASTRGLTLQVYTGTHGVATLPNDRGIDTKLYLYADNNRKLIPVPEILWKIVYDKNSMRAVVFVTVNNPHTNNPSEVCSLNVCNNIRWLKWNPGDIQRGYSYCCDYTDRKFSTTVVDRPLLRVTGLLTG